MAKKVTKTAAQKLSKKSKNKKDPQIRIMGAMSGTSCDALDVAVVEFSSNHWRPTWTSSVPYPAELRKRVLELQSPGTALSLADLSALDRDLGKWYGESFQRLLKSIPKSERPQVISNHGQTVGHFPSLKGGGTTVQLGDPSRIAEITGLTVVSHHRYGDVASGGQGAPFVPPFHALLSASVLGETKGIAFHNLGGISNFTYLGPKGEILASDTGPANVWIDGSMYWLTKGKKSFDENGTRALEGEVDLKALDKMLKHPFLKKPLPKSTGRDDFPLTALEGYLKSMKPEAAVPTLTAFTVESIARAYEQNILKKGLPLKKIILGGGGTKNETLVAWLQYRLQPVVVETVDDHGLDSQYIEAQAFAYLGFRALHGLRLGGVWTGGENARSSGRITPGENWKELLQRLP